MTTQHRVVVTGLGAVTPLGLDVASFWDGLSSGRNGIRSISAFDASDLPVRFAGEVQDFDPTRFMDRKEAKRLARFSQFAVAASLQAWQDSGLEMAHENAERVGVLIGSGMGGLSVIEEGHQQLMTKGPGRVSPFLIPMSIVNMASGNVSIVLGAKGPNYCAVSACSSGTHALGDALRILQRGDAEVFVAGGTESAVTPLAIAAFANAKALSGRNDAPEKASRPFDAGRDGFVMGEGAGVLILETLEHAQARNARIYAELVGYGASGDAYHITMPGPEGEGAGRAMAAALQEAGLAPEDVEYINAHGTSTPANDRLETAAIKGLFGSHAAKVAISSNKSMVGHLLGAAGAVEALATVLTIYNGKIPPTINYETPDPECDLDYVPNQAREKAVKVAMTNNMGFGGHNASLVFRAF